MLDGTLNTFSWTLTDLDSRALLATDSRALLATDSISTPGTRTTDTKLLWRVRLCWFTSVIEEVNYHPQALEEIQIGGPALVVKDISLRQKFNSTVNLILIL
jgi:hypothetical protein